MKGIIKYCLLISMLLGTVILGMAQNAVKIYVKPNHDNIELRWQFTNEVSWAKHIKSGFDIWRQDSKQLKKLNADTIRAITLKEWAIQHTDTSGPEPVGIQVHPWINVDSTEMMAIGLIHYEESGIKFNNLDDNNGFDFTGGVDEIRWFNHSMACVLSFNATKSSGLYYWDQKVDVKTYYKYYLVPRGKAIVDTLGSVELNSSDSYPLIAPTDIRSLTQKNKCILGWHISDTGYVKIASYNIYRSEKIDRDYQVINGAPLLALVSADMPDTNRLNFVDSTLERKKVYFYKIKGTDVFGEETPFSEPHKVEQITRMETAPDIIKWEPNKIHEVQLEWKMKLEDLKLVTRFELFRSTNPDSTFELLNKPMNPSTYSYLDKNPTNNNYYQIRAYGVDGDTAFSSIVYAHVPDSIPPKAPQIYYGKCDSNGVVNLRWKRNKESDIQSYKILRANFMNEEFSTVTQTSDTSIADSIPIDVLDKAVYYVVQAEDNSYNLSPYSNPFQVIRPDILPPSTPLFITYESRKNGVYFEIISSSSIDVQRQIIFRRNKGSQHWTVMKMFEGDSLRQKTWIDQTAKGGNWYEYTIVAIDSSNNRSVMIITQIKALDMGIRLSVNDLRAISNKRNKQVKLSWNYSDLSAERFLIYRSREGQRMTLYKSVAGNQREFFDKKLIVDSQYTYRVKAVFSDGAESKFSDPVTIKY